MAIGAKVVSETLVGSDDLSSDGFDIVEEFADRFEVIEIQILFGDLGGVVGGEDFHFHDVSLRVIGPHLFAADVAGKM